MYPNTNSNFKGNLPAGEVARTLRCVGDTYRIGASAGFFLWVLAERAAGRASAALTFLDGCRRCAASASANFLLLCIVTFPVGPSA